MNRKTSPGSETGQSDGEGTNGDASGHRSTVASTSKVSSSLFDRIDR